ncbi:MAG: DNA-binding protein [Halobacteria archaeon]
MAAAESDGLRFREPARRLFAYEIERSNLLTREGEGTYARRYLWTPTGAKCNRIFFVGTLTDVSRVRDDMVRARVSDPTGSWSFFSGRFDRETTDALSRMETPSLVALTAKVRSYESRGSELVAFRPETVLSSTRAVRNRWILDTAKQTEERLSLLGGDPALQRVREHYPGDLEPYRHAAKQALGAMAEGAEVEIVDLL